MKAVRQELIHFLILSDSQGEAEHVGTNSESFRPPYTLPPFIHKILTMDLQRNIQCERFLKYMLDDVTYIKCDFIMPPS